jgi:hypothetical protein
MHPLIFFLVHTYVTHIVIYTDSILDYATGYTIVNDTIMLYEDIQETELSSLRRPLYCLHIILKCQCNIIYTYKRTKHILNNACRHCQVPINIICMPIIQLSSRLHQESNGFPDKLSCFTCQLHL